MSVVIRKRFMRIGIGCGTEWVEAIRRISYLRKVAFEWHAAREARDADRLAFWLTSSWEFRLRSLYDDISVSIAFCGAERGNGFDDSVSGG